MVKLDDIVSLCKRRGFIYPGSDVYGGMSGTWDYGPLGLSLKQKVMRCWWDFFVEKREDIYGVDAAIIMNPKTWVASGHTTTFSDPLVECNECHGRFRADKLGENISEKVTTEAFRNLNIACPTCKSHNWGEITRFGGMFETKIGIDGSLAYLRPET